MPPTSVAQHTEVQLVWDLSSSCAIEIFRRVFHLRKLRLPDVKSMPRTSQEQSFASSRMTLDSAPLGEYRFEFDLINWRKR
jgi:hypothetical protein